MKRGWGVRAAIALVTVALAAVSASSQPLSAGAHRATAGHGYVPGSAVATGAPIHGIILASSNQPLDAVIGDIPRLAADGINLVSIYVTQYIDTVTANTIHSGTYTPTDQELELAISLAHEYGMAVQIAPTVWTVRPYVWRGAYAPTNVNAFFNSYRTMMDHYATLAQANNVELLSIGSEYASLERYTSQWALVAKEARARFGGLTTYMATTQDLFTIPWWKSVDYIGVSPYYPMSYAPRPTYAEAVASWTKHWFPKIRRISVKYNRPILFNEIGYLSALGAGARPYQPTTTQPASEQVQADLYRALLDAADSQSWLRGIVFFHWTAPVAAPVDRTYSPRDKLAECVIAEHWAGPNTPMGIDGHPLICLGGAAATGSALSH